MIEFTTQRGAKVCLSDDANISINGHAMAWGALSVIDHPAHGPAIKGCDNVVPVPAGHVDAVRALIAAHVARVAAQVARSFEDTKAYHAGHDRVVRAMGGRRG